MPRCGQKSWNARSSPSRPRTTTSGSRPASIVTKSPGSASSSAEAARCHARANSDLLLVRVPLVTEIGRRREQEPGLLRARGHPAHGTCGRFHPGCGRISLVCRISYGHLTRRRSGRDGRDVPVAQLDEALATEARLVPAVHDLDRQLRGCAPSSPRRRRRRSRRCRRGAARRTRRRRRTTFPTPRPTARSSRASGRAGA